MCGTAGMSVPAHAVAGAVRSAGCNVSDAAPAAYRTSTTKKHSTDTFPCVVARDAGTGLALETLAFGVTRFKCHNAFFENWQDRKTWKTAAAAPDGRCAMVVTSFVEGITARRPDGDVFFVLGLRVGDAFVIMTTRAQETELLGARARRNEGFGQNRCPVYVDGAGAAAWAGHRGAFTLDAAVEATRRNALGLVLGAGKRGPPPPPPGQRSLAAMWGATPKKKKRSVEPAVKAEVEPEKPAVVDLTAD